MMLWFVFALMTVAAIFAVLWPLGRSARVQNQGSEVVVYKDQLTEIERDLASGLIAAPEAEAARVEISRRLLAAASSETVSVHDDTALVHCRLQIDLEVKGAPRQVDSIALTVWIKDEGRWQVLAVHSTPYPKG